MKTEKEIKLEIQRIDDEINRTKKIDTLGNDTLQYLIDKACDIMRIELNTLYWVLEQNSQLLSQTK